MGNDARTIGAWTLAEPLGRGGSGRVFLASNSKGNVAAVKIVEWNSRTRNNVDREVRTFEKLKLLANSIGAERRIVQLVEVIGHPELDEPSSPPQMPFRDVALVMTPMTPITLGDIIKNGSAW